MKNIRTNQLQYSSPIKTYKAIIKTIFEEKLDGKKKGGQL